MIASIIDRDYTSVSILEEMSNIAEWLVTDPYLVIVDEELCSVGILVQRDVDKHPRRLVMDCDFAKPVVTPYHTLTEVLALMKGTGLFYLPVIDDTAFMGVISAVNVVKAM